VKFNLFASYGEAFWVPWYSKARQQSWGMLVEAKEAGPFDRFRDCQTGEQVLRRTQELIREYMPWDYEMFEHAEMCDEHAWLVGQVTPEVRQVVGTLPSGRQVMAVGDTAHALDPIGGQGANNGNKMVRIVVKERARGVLRETFGSTRTPLLRGAVGIVRGQLRQRLGRSAGHPGT